MITPEPNRHEALTSWDRRHLLHPASDFEVLATRGPLVVDRADGVHLWDIDGTRYLDAFSGLMNVNVGYGRDSIADRAAEQIRSLSYVPMFFARTSEPPIVLAHKLATLAPHLPVWHFTSGGSEANESAIKLARLYFHSTGRPEKTVIISRTGSYHGVTYGALSATSIDSYRTGFGDLPGGFDQIPSDDADALATAIERIGSSRVAAFLSEPIALPSGMWIPDDTYWQRIRTICDENNVLLIADEVVTGFGRTGTMFALEHWGVRADLMTIAKGLTSGYAPLGAIGMSGEIAEAITTSQRKLMHGLTATGHPTCCAIGLENIRILEAEDLLANARTLGTQLRDRLQPLVELDHVTAVHGIGLLTAITFVPHSTTPTHADVAETELFSRGVITRSYGDFLVFGPPLVANSDDIEVLANALTEAVTDQQVERSAAR